MSKKEYAHLVKPLTIRKPPAGLYDTAPRVWMEGKDLEGFNCNFSYGFIKETSVFHPTKGMIIHPYDECLVFAGIYLNSILYLGADVSIEIGEEREEHFFDKPSVVVLPKGTPHGPVKVSKVDNPIVHYSIGLNAKYSASPAPKSSKPADKHGSKYSHLIKPLISKHDVTAAKDENGQVRQSSVDSLGILHPEGVPGMGPANADQLVWLYGDQLEGMNLDFTWGFYSKSGIWHRISEGHKHPEEEILLFVGLDPDKLDYLGAGFEIGMGENFEREIFDKPSVAICPAGFTHLPLITRWVDKPYGFIVICLSGEHGTSQVD